MDYFFGFKSAISQPEAEPSPADTVLRLVERVTSSTLLEDKRDACRAIKALSKKYRLEVGAHGLDALIEVLNGQPDLETSSFVLDTLCNVTSSEVFEEEGVGAPVGEQFTEIFLKKAENVISVITLLDEYDFHIRLPAIRLLMNLLNNKSKEMQEIVLACPMGVAKLIDILSDSRDFVRNEALLLLIQLTKSNANIQNIIAYERGFDQLFQVVRSEGYSDGGIVVDDSLQLMLNLLKRNASNQTVFREESCMKHITPFFQSCQQSEGGDPTGSWSIQKISNVHSMLQVVRTLVSPANATQVVSPAQKNVAGCGLLSELCALLMSPGVPADILSEIICTVGESIRGCRSNQEFFGQVMASSSPPRTALVVLLMSMVNEKQPVPLRASVLYCFECFLYKNDFSQGQIIQALLPTSAEAMQQISAGQLLCGGLFSTDCLSHWLSSVALSHALVNNTNNRELLLRVHLAIAKDVAPVSLLQQAFSILQLGGKLQTRLGILTLLSTWLADSPNSVAQFLKLPNAVAFLTALVASNEHDDQEVLVQSLCAFLLGLCVVYNNDANSNFSKESLCQLITKRIGVETFVDKLAEIAKHEVYSKALKHPQIRINTAADIQFDHEFCRLYKGLEGVIAKAVAPPTSPKGAESPSESMALAKYKDVIREQDGQIQHLRQRLAALEGGHIAAQSKIEELNVNVQHLQDQNTLLKAQRNNNVIIDEGEPSTPPPESSTDKLVKELEALRLDNERLRGQLEEQQQAANHYVGIPPSNGIAVEFASTQSASIMDSFTTHEDVQVCSFFRQPESTSAANPLELELKAVKSRLEAMETELGDSQKRLADCLSVNAGLQDEIERVKRDQEDLLVLLADQDGQVLKYKDRLKNLGQTVSEDEDDELDDLAGDDELSV
ncbi:general vesicular transport factor p115-like isoform X1 [Daphnia pulicaria]|uniref:general vesicular transport factor p115-like isoform X1 n=1 Tax=Daphnia pulicaria TaxID=35523 RepID=UPI001EECBA06|nr:general vesicular transport factor p115-like isoform X1 [Daphnia pulicaria]